MQSNNNSNKEYMEIWAAIEPEVKALNRSMYKKRKSRKILFLILPFLLIGTCWFAKESTDKKVPTIENEISQTKSKDTDHLLRTNAKQVEKHITTTHSKIPKSTNSNNISFLKQTPNIEHTLDFPLKISAPKNKKTVIKTNSLSNQKIKNSALDQSNNTWVEKAILRKNEISNSSLINKLPILKPTFLDTKLVADTINFTNYWISLPMPTWGKKWASTLTVSNGVSYAQRQLAVKDENSLDIITYRNATESTLYANHHGLTYTLKHRSNFKFTSGINYTSIKEVYKHSQTIFDTFFVDGVEAIITHLDGTKTEVDGKAAVKRTTLTEYEYFHKYNLLEIPLLVGYERYWGDFKFGGQVGVLTNISLSTKGKRLGIESTKQEIGQLGYQSRINLGYYAGLSVQKNILPKVALSLAPTVRIYPDISSKENLIRQRYKLYGLNVNLTFKL